MSLVSAAIMPHPPILVPAIGQENLEKLKATQKAFAKIQKDFEEKEVETIIIISPHGLIQEKAFTMNLSPKFECNFEAFGDFSIRRTYAGDVGLAYKIREKLETKASIQLISEEYLDHGSSVPLYLTTEKLPNVKIIPIYFSGLSPKEHFDFGTLLQHEIISNQERIAVIASGDLSHRLTQDAPAGYNPSGKKFDKKLASLLLQKKSDSIIGLDQKLVDEAGECGLKSILILLGILDDINYAPELFSYEGPFGVGYMVMNFKF